MVKKGGYTLIEMIVAIAIFLIVSVSAVDLVTSFIKGSLKADQIKEIKQNGNYALSVMDRAIRNADGVVSCSATSIVINNGDNTTTTFAINADNITSSNSPLLAAGYTVVNPGTDSSFTCKQSADTPAVVTIKFTLQKGAALARSEEKASQSFQTTVTLRTY